MIWPLALVCISLTLCATGVALYGLSSWKSVRVQEALARRAEAQRRRAEVSAWAASAERVAQQVHDLHRLTGAHKSDNLKPPAPPSRPHFGFKPHVVTNNDNPEGAA